MHVRWRTHGQPGRLEGLDGTALKVKEYEIDTGFVTVLTRSGCELRVGVGLLEIPRMHIEKRRRADTMNNVDPLSARERYNAQQREARHALHDPPPRHAFVPRDGDQRAAVTDGARQLLLLGNGGAGKTATAIARMERIRSALPPHAVGQKGVIISQTNGNTARIIRLLRCRQLFDKYDVYTRQQTLMLESDEYLNLPNGAQEVVRKIRRGERADPLDPDSFKYAIGWKVCTPRVPTLVSFGTRSTTTPDFTTSSIR